MMTMGLTAPAFFSSLSTFEVLALAIVVPLSVALFFFQDKLVHRLIVFALAVTGIYAADTWWSTADQPEKSARLAIQQLNGANPEIKALRTFETTRDAANVGGAGAVKRRSLTRSLAYWLLPKELRENRRRWAMPWYLAITFGLGAPAAPTQR